MCFAPQRRALFRDLNFQKWSEPLVFCTFWLPNVLRATTACTFSRSELPKVVRTPSVLYILTSKCASRHNGVHFFNISTSKSGPILRCFVPFRFEIGFAPHNFSSLISPDVSAPAALASLLFDPPEPQIIGKTQCFATFLPFHASASSFFLLFFSSTLLSSNLSLLSASSLLCFSSVHIVGSLTSRLPSIIVISHSHVASIDSDLSCHHSFAMWFWGSGAHFLTARGSSVRAALDRGLSLKFSSAMKDGQGQREHV